MGSSVERTIFRASTVSFCVGIVLLGAYEALPALPSVVRGVVAAMGAVIVFGCASIPGKHPKASGDTAAGALAFQFWATLGNAACTLILCGLIGVRGELMLSSGALGALILTLTQTLAWGAISRLGAAAGPGIWCGIGMVTAFGWGFVGFGEEVADAQAALGAVALLVCGIIGIGVSRLEGEPRGAEYARLPQREGGADGGRPKRRSLATGVLLAVGTGVADGSLMTAYKLAEREATEKAAEDVAVAYLLSFGILLPIVSLPVILLALTLLHGKDVRVVVAAPGMRAPAAAAGCLWALANVMSVHATKHLGQAVGFPLTQVCVIVSAAWGVACFGELPRRAQRLGFAASSTITMVGATILASQRTPGR